jgi:hypothetical protein
MLTVSKLLSEGTHKFSNRCPNVRDRLQTSLGGAGVWLLLGWSADRKGWFALSGLVAEVAVGSQGAAPLCPGLS